MIIKAGVLVDFGNSETRFRLLSGNLRYKGVLPNHFAKMKAGDSIVEEEGYFFKHGGLWWGAGEYARREFGKAGLKPTSQYSKVDQLTTALSMNLVFCECIEQLHNHFGVPYNSMEVTFTVSVLLPPMEHGRDSDKMKEIIRSITHVEMIKPYAITDGGFDFSIDENVRVTPEGVAAFFAACFHETEEGLVERPENAVYTKGLVLILDIGAGTTDMALIRDSRILSSSKRTLSMGGNTIMEKLRDLCDNDPEVKYDPEPEALEHIIETGTLPIGVGEIHVERLLNLAKDAYLDRLLREIIRYREGAGISLKDIKGVLAVGGGALPAIRDGEIVSPSLAANLVKSLKSDCPYIGEVSSCGQSVREMNIIGLEYLYKYT